MRIRQDGEATDAFVAPSRRAFGLFQCVRSPASSGDASTGIRKTEPVADADWMSFHEGSLHGTDAVDGERSRSPLRVQASADCPKLFLSKSCVPYQGLRSRECSLSPSQVSVYPVWKVTIPLPRTHFSTRHSTDVGSCQRREDVSLAPASSSPPRGDVVRHLLQRTRP